MKVYLCKIDDYEGGWNSIDRVCATESSAASWLDEVVEDFKDDEEITLRRDENELNVEYSDRFGRQYMYYPMEVE